MTLRKSNISIRAIAQTHAFRCDEKHYAEETIARVEAVRAGKFFELGAFIPSPFLKGVQHIYLDSPGDDSVPVVNTLSVQRLSIDEGNCRHITRDDFDTLDAERKLRKGDVLLTMDGGVSIGKPVLFQQCADYTVDSHVSIIRPVGLDALALVYLLASPLGQLQFKRAESGASGQTAVTEEDIRRFVFPASVLDKIDGVVSGIEAERARIAKERDALNAREQAAWDSLSALLG